MLREFKVEDWSLQRGNTESGYTKLAAAEHYRGETMADRKPMTKTKLVKHLADTFGMHKPMAADVLSEIFDLAVKETK